MGRWLPDVNGPSFASLACSSVVGAEICCRTVPVIDAGIPAGASVNRNNRGSNCQKLLLLTNILSQAPESWFSFGSSPTELSSVAIRPMRSSFCNKLRFLKIPSRLMLIRQSPLGLPNSGVFAEFAVCRCRSGSCSWKYHHSVM